MTRVVFTAACLVIGFVIAGTFPREDPLSSLGMFLIFVSQLAMIADLWEEGPDRHGVAAIAFTLMGLFLAEVSRPGDADPTGIWWQILFLISTLLYSAGRFDGVLRWAGLLTVLLAHAGMRLWEWREVPVFSSESHMDRYATELGLLLMIGSTVLIALWVGTRGARTADLALEQERRRRAEEALARTVVFEQREADRFIHDEVLHTLRLVAFDRSAVPADVAVEACSALGHRLRGTSESPSEHEGLRRRLRDAAAALPEPLDVQVSGRDTHLPPDVEEAFVRATGEALRNVALHAETEEARVLLSRVGPRVVVTISDSGAGFDPSLTSDRRGFSESILARMSDVGGVAWVTSEAGRGTIVRLEWEPKAPGINRPWLRASYGSAASVYRAMLLLALPLVLHNIWSAILHADHLEVEWAGWAASILAVVVYLWGARRGVQRGLGFWPSLAVTLTVWAATVLNVLALPADGFRLSLLWIPAGVMPLAILQTLFRPRRALVTTCVGVFVILVGFVLTQGVLALVDGTGSAGAGTASTARISPYEALPLLLVPAMGLLILGTLRVVLEHAAEKALMAHETSIRSFNTVLLHEAERIALDDRTERRADAVIDFVSAIAEGRLDPSDALVRSEADELERAVRAQTSSEARLRARDRKLEHQVDRLRAEDVDVTVRSVGEPPVEVRQWLAGLLGDLGSDAVTSIRATVLAGRDADEWRIAVVIRPGSDRLFETVVRHSGGAAVDGDRIHLEHHVTSHDARNS